MIKTVLKTFLRISRLELFPVRIKAGYAKGACWSLYPWTSYWRGTHEPGIQRQFEKLGGGDIRGWSCWDIGAHFGLYSVGLALRTGPSGQVAAFEPNPVSYRRLELHRHRNKLSWLKTFDSAASDRTGHAELFTYGDLGTTTTHLPYEGETRTENARPIRIATVALDELVASGELRAPRFVKLDAEGHGHRALQGMRLTLVRERPVIMMGFHSPQERQGTLSLLEPLDYRCETIDEHPEQVTGGSLGDFLLTPG